MGAALHLGYDFNEYVALEYGVDYLGSFKSNFNTDGNNTIDGKLSAITLAPEYNLKLSEERALSVADNLIEEGVETQRITYNGMGEANPVESNETENGRKANRRVEVAIPAFKYQMEEKQSQ